MTKPRARLLVINDPYAMRISSELAMEIGFNESILLLQLEYLISISTTEEIEGRIWTRQSLEELHQFFPFWSPPTISRTLKSLEEQQLIIVGSFNKIGYDRTQWFALNEEGISRLESIAINDAIFQNEKCKRSKCKMDLIKMKNGSDQNEKSIFQNETTIPETPTEISPKNSAETHGDEPPPAGEVEPELPKRITNGFYQFRELYRRKAPAYFYKVVDRFQLLSVQDDQVRIAAPPEVVAEASEPAHLKVMSQDLSGLFGFLPHIVFVPGDA